MEEEQLIQSSIKEGGTTLYLGSGKISKVKGLNYSALAQSIAKHATDVSVLDLSNNSLDSESFEKLVPGLMSLNKLTHIDLKKNPIGHKSASSLAQLISVNSELTELYIPYCDFTDESLHLIAPALGKYGKIEVLNALSNNFSTNVDDILPIVYRHWKNTKAFRSLWISNRTFSSSDEIKTWLSSGRGRFSFRKPPKSVPVSTIDIQQS